MSPKETRIALLLLALAFCAAAGYGIWQYISDPPRPWLVRWQVDRYLRKEARTRTFKVDFPFPSRAELDRVEAKTTARNAPKGARTGKDFENLCEEYFPLKQAELSLERRLERKPRKEWEDELAAKREALTPIVADLWDFQRLWETEIEAQHNAPVQQVRKAYEQHAQELRGRLDEAGSYAQIFRLLGGELLIVKRLVAAKNPDCQQLGMRIALRVARHAAEDAMSGWLAGRIVEGYVLPNIDLASASRNRGQLEGLLGECIAVFQEIGEPQSVVRVLQTVLKNTESGPRADQIRAQIAMAYEQAGEPREALKYLRQIKDTSDRRISRQISRLESQNPN